jgi:hypothetical protein
MAVEIRRTYVSALSYGNKLFYSLLFQIPQLDSNLGVQCHRLYSFN